MDNEQIFYYYSNSNISLVGNEIEVVKTLPQFKTSDLISDLLTFDTPSPIVIPRLRAIPFGEELERDVKSFGGELLNSYREHRNIANLYNWVHLLGDLTAPAYRLSDIPQLPEGEYFVKGETNSIKNNWFTHSYASTKKHLIEVVGNVLNDQYVGNQEIAIRPFQNFRKVGEAVNGRPVFNERRLFFLDGELLSGGYYWSNMVEDFGEPEVLNVREYRKTIKSAIEKVKHLARFIVIDLAEFDNGTWQVVELNDGCMSGLSGNDPLTLWSKVGEKLSR